MTHPICILTFGACLLHGPLNAMAREKIKMSYPNYGPMPGTYTFGEIFQAIDVLHGKKVVPDEMRPYCNMRPAFRAVPRSANFEGVDVVLVEPSSPIDLTFRGYSINRTTMSQQFQPIRATGKEATRLSNIWLRNGLIGQDESARISAAEKLAKLVPGDMENADLARAIILETTPSKADVAGGFARIKDIIGRPIGVIVYIFQYMADGRAISWPAGYHEEVVAAAAAADLPVFEPSRVVTGHGVEKALRPDLRHYNEAFLPTMADALVEFGHSVVAGASGVGASDASVVMPK